MNIQLATLILSLLGDIQIQTKMPPGPPLQAVYVTWSSSGTVTYECPDASSGIDPMGHAAVVTQGGQTEHGWTAVSVPVLLYPTGKQCSKDIVTTHHTIIPSAAEATAFLKDCHPEVCRGSMRPATDAEIVDYALGKRSWRVTHVPAGDAFSNPDGLYEVWAKDERTFDSPLGSGRSAMEAVADALKGERA